VGVCEAEQGHGAQTGGTKKETEGVKIHMYAPKSVDGI
jgi:hypothetical protein